MQDVILVIAVGLAGGVAVGLQGPLTSLISQRLGTVESIFIVHLGGAILAGIPLLVWGGGHLSAWRNVPWYALGAGALGLVVLGAVSFTIPRVGSATTVTLIIVAELIAAAVLDQFGLLETSIRPMGLSRAVGFLVLFIGTYLVMH